MDPTGRKTERLKVALAGIGVAVMFLVAITLLAPVFSEVLKRSSARHENGGSEVARQAEYDLAALRI